MAVVRIRFAIPERHWIQAPSADCLQKDEIATRVRASHKEGLFRQPASVRSFCFAVSLINPTASGPILPTIFECSNGPGARRQSTSEFTYGTFECHRPRTAGGLSSKSARALEPRSWCGFSAESGPLISSAGADSWFFESRCRVSRTALTWV